MSHSVVATAAVQRLLAGSAAILSLACGVSPAPRAEWVEPLSGMVFVLVPAGQFVMEAPSANAPPEAPAVPHAVVMARAFHLGKYEVTQGEWRAVMGSNPSWFQGDDRRPVEYVSWHDVTAFLARLEQRSPRDRFRLPTEAEWEYACRAGGAAAFASGDTLGPGDGNVAFSAMPDVSSIDRSATGRAEATALLGDGGTRPVGSYRANAWGLHDLSGNVWEWTSDPYCPDVEGPVVNPRATCEGTLKVIRGGSWYFAADSARCAVRYSHAPADRGFSLGFRVVREPRGL